MTQDQTPRDPRLLIVLDLDEACWSSHEDPDRPGQHLIRPRAHLGTLLDTLLEDFQIGIWTAATPGWAAQGLGAVLTETGTDLHTHARFLWTRERCTWRYDERTGERALCKPLSKVWRSTPFTKERTLAIDDRAENYRCAYGNLIKVSPDTGDASDRELLLLSRYLRTLKDCGNVRQIEKRGWRDQAERL